MTITPWVDLHRLESNIGRFHATVESTGATVRPHVKAHRSVQIAARQLAAGARGVALTEAREAECYIAAGVRDIVVAWPWLDAWRMHRFARLARRCDLSVHVDCLSAVAGLSAAARAAGSVIGVRLVVSGSTTEVPRTREEVLVLARAVVRSPGLWLGGVTGYRPLLGPEAVRARRAGGRDLARLLVDTADYLRARGLPCPAVAVGGTPTAEGALEVDGVTEICSGAYALLDAGLAAIGMCGYDDVALRVGTTVLGPGRTGADHLFRGGQQPWAPVGAVATLPDGTPVRGEAGERVELLPVHICPLMARLPFVDTAEGRWDVCRFPDEERS